MPFLNKIEYLETYERGVPENCRVENYGLKPIIMVFSLYF